MCMCAHSVLLDSFATPWTVAHQAPLSMEFSRREYWSGLPFSAPGDRPDPATEAASLASPALGGRFFTTEPPGKLLKNVLLLNESIKYKQYTFK